MKPMRCARLLNWISAVVLAAGLGVASLGLASLSGSQLVFLFRTPPRLQAGDIVFTDYVVGFDAGWLFASRTCFGRGPITSQRQPRGSSWFDWIVTRDAGPNVERWRIATWLPATVLIASSGAVLWRSRSRRIERTRLGLCALCGYNLTGNTSGRCPECGAVVASSAASSAGRAGGP